MAKLIALKLLPLVFMLSWLGLFTSAEWTSSTNTSCISKIIPGVCNATIDDYWDCCTEITHETFTYRECMCTAFGTDVNFVAGFRLYCSRYVNQILMLCPNASLIGMSTSEFFSPPPPGQKTNKTTAIVVPVVILVVLTIVVISIMCICRGKKMHQNCSSYVELRKEQGLLSESVSSGRASLAPTPMSKVPRSWFPVNYNKAEIKSNNKADFMSKESLVYDFATLVAATNNFSVDNKIGRGGFGSVYKGTLSDGQEIAVKRLSPDSGQGDKEFKAEIELLAKLKHRNLVQLLGFCVMKGEALLVYELAVNKSLDHFLFDSDEKREELNWSIRFKIINGIARGMLYLHDDSPQRTIHRDLKAANVLLDAKMSPKIADFGLARKCAPDQTHAQTNIVIGTRGYMAPEYRDGRQLFSLKTDVYAFGVLVLEIISGKRVTTAIKYQSKELCEDLLTYAWRCWDDENPLELMDPLLKETYSSDQVTNCIQLGLLCVQDESSERPKMSTIVHRLNSNRELDVLATPRCPQGLFYGGSNRTTTSLTEQSTTVSSSGAISSSAKFDFKDPR